MTASEMRAKAQELIKKADKIEQQSLIDFAKFVIQQLKKGDLKSEEIKLKATQLELI